MSGRLHFYLDRLRERLWVRPLAFCILSVVGVLLAKTADHFDIAERVPEISSESIETLLSIMASSMLVVATFAVGSMVSAYASASRSATPRSFPLIISDDVSQNALSTFIGAFIFSIVALISMQNGYFNSAGHFALFVITIGVFAGVVLTFVRWTDNIARLGRLGSTVEKVENAAATALTKRRRSPTLGGSPLNPTLDRGNPIYAGKIGYVQHIDVPQLQQCAEQFSVRVTVAALPGTFMAPGKPLLYIAATEQQTPPIDESNFADAFEIGEDRVFEQDPRFGLIALAEIAARALSPAVNDPGTAIDIIGSYIRLFTAWAKPISEDHAPGPECPLVHVPELSVREMLNDAFTAIARDGARTIEVQIRLQKALASLASIGDSELEEAAIYHSRLASTRARQALLVQEDIAAITTAAKWSDQTLES